MLENKIKYNKVMRNYPFWNYITYIEILSNNHHPIEAKSVMTINGYTKFHNNKILQSGQKLWTKLLILL